MGHENYVLQKADHYGQAYRFTHVHVAAVFYRNLTLCRRWPGGHRGDDHLFRDARSRRFHHAMNGHDNDH